MCSHRFKWLYLGEFWSPSTFILTSSSTGLEPNSSNIVNLRVLLGLFTGEWAVQESHWSWRGSSAYYRRQKMAPHKGPSGAWSGVGDRLVGLTKPCCHDIFQKAALPEWTVCWSYWSYGSHKRLLEIDVEWKVPLRSRVARLFLQMFRRSTNVASCMNRSRSCSSVTIENNFTIENFLLQRIGAIQLEYDVSLLGFSDFVDKAEKLLVVRRLWRWCCNAAYRSKKIKQVYFAQSLLALVAVWSSSEGHLDKESERERRVIHVETLGFNRWEIREAQYI